MKLNKLAMIIACSLAVTGCGKEEGTKLDSSPAVADTKCKTKYGRVFNTLNQVVS